VGCGCAITAVGVAHEAPVVELYVGIAFLCVHQAEALARAFLVVQQLAGGRIGERGMGEDQLPWRELARVRRVMSGSGAEEGDLETERFPIWRFQPAGGVPPLRAEGGMRTEVAWKLQRFSGYDLGELRGSGKGVCADDHQYDDRQPGKKPASHEEAGGSRNFGDPDEGEVHQRLHIDMEK
jgi:hypothetical protein